jgi:hypothetical protein
MSKAIIRNGVWTRRIPGKWRGSGEGRTDIFKSVLADPRLRFARYVFSTGMAVLIPADELRRVVVSGPSHYADKIWGPFNINPYLETVAGQKVRMELEDAH